MVVKSENGKYRNQIIGYVIAALLGGSAGSFGLRIVAPPRDDPFYGSQGRVLEERVRRHDVRLDSSDQLIARIDERVELCLRELRTGKSRAHDRVTAIEHKIEKLEWEHERLKDIGILGINTIENKE